MCLQHSNSPMMPTTRCRQRIALQSIISNIECFFRQFGCNVQSRFGSTEAGVATSLASITLAMRTSLENLAIGCVSTMKTGAAPI